MNYFSHTFITPHWNYIILDLISIYLTWGRIITSKPFLQKNLFFHLILFSWIPGAFINTQIATNKLEDRSGLFHPCYFLIIFEPPCCNSFGSVYKISVCFPHSNSILSFQIERVLKWGLFGHIEAKPLHGFGDSLFDKGKLPHLTFSLSKDISKLISKRLKLLLSEIIGYWLSLMLFFPDYPFFLKKFPTNAQENPEQN